MVLNLDKELEDKLVSRFIDFNLYHFQKTNKSYHMKTIDTYALHAIDQYKKFGDMYVRPRLTIPERQIIHEISCRIAKHWDLFKMIFEDDKEYQEALGKAWVWCQELKKYTENGPKGPHDLAKVFLACESFMLACDDYYAVDSPVFE